MTHAEQILKEVKNQKKHDKGSIGYMIGMMEQHSCYSLYWDSISRTELIDKFTSLINQPEKISRLNNGHCFKTIFQS